jgi:uncharacterized protein with HEPN domain
MCASCEKVIQFTHGLDQTQFLADQKTYDAVMRNLEIIGEAAKHVPNEVRSQHPEVDWRRVAAFRDVAIHEYFGIDVDVVWDIVQNKLPPLYRQIRQLLSG